MSNTIDLLLRKEYDLVIACEQEEGGWETAKEGTELGADLYRIELLDEGVMPRKLTTMSIYHRDIEVAEVKLDLDTQKKIANALNGNPMNVTDGEMRKYFRARPRDVITEEFRFNLPKRSLERVAIYSGDFTQPGYRWRENLVCYDESTVIGARDRINAFETVKSLQGALQEALKRKGVPVKKKDRLRFYLRNLEKVL